jgi:hypothetical protein
LYLPFLPIVRDPFSDWWSWFGVPGWPVQIIHSNDTFAVIGGTFLTLSVIGVLSWFSATSRKRIVISSVVLLGYAIGSAVLIQNMIHAG